MTAWATLLAGLPYWDRECSSGCSTRRCVVARHLIIAHAGRPLHTDTAFFLLRRHPNLYCDISSVPPKALLRYYPWVERVADKAMFGSDWPAGARDIGQNIQQFLSLDLSDELKKKILRDNALRVFRLAEH